MARREKRSRNKGSAGNNRKLGEDFLLRTSKKEGIVETNSGLLFMVIEDKSGRKPALFDTIKIHQRALLLNGKILIDTYRENRPDEAKVDELIEGLQEGLQIMSVGSRYKFWIPPDLAWGKKGSGNNIPPNSVLIFDIRLVEIN